jgi:hypothetical protein
MSYPIYPILSVKPSYVSDLEPEDVGIVSDMNDGSQTSRPRFTRSRLTLTYRYNALTENDKSILLNYYRNVVKGCSLIWDWVDPDPKSEFYGQTFHVRFVSKPKFLRSTPSRWSTEIVLREA